MKVPLREQIGLSVLIAAWIIYGGNFVAERLVSADTSGVDDLRIATAEHEGGAEEQVAEAEPVDFMTALAQADATEGAKVFRQCKACHSIEEGGKNKVGPNLYGTVGSSIAFHQDFSYSDALASHGGEWTYENLDHWLADPSGFASGTKMTFKGIKDNQDRANLVAYMADYSPDAPPLPEAPAEEETADTGGDGDAMDQAEEAAGEAMDTAEKAMDEAKDMAGDAAESAQQMAEGGGSQLASLLQDVSAADGQKVYRKCQACHTIDKGGPNRVGPNLYGIVGAEIAAAEGFNYSDALKSHDGTWTYAKLDAWLEDPMGWAKGTRMAFPGVKDAEDRAAVIKFMRENADEPEPLP